MHDPDDPVKPVPLRMATIHGFIAGWGLGAYASIIVFILAPRMPNIFFAALVGTCFGLGTMLMLVIIGTAFANVMRIKKLSMDQIKYVGRSAAARTLYLGGLAFSIIGGLILAFPLLDSLAISTGSPIPNLDSVGVASVLVLLTVGVIGFSNLYLGYREITRAPGKNP